MVLEKGQTSNGLTCIACHIILSLDVKLFILLASHF